MPGLIPPRLYTGVSKTLLLINLAILVANFALALGSTETQVRVLRTTARVAFGSVPRARAPRPRTEKVRETADVRLVKYLAKLRAIRRLDGAQVAELFRCVFACRAALLEEAARLGQGKVEAGRLEGLRARLRGEAERRLEEAGIENPGFRKELATIVLSSTG